MKSRPKFEEEYNYIKQRLIEEFGEAHRIHQFPIIIIHELDIQGRGRGHSRKKQDTYVMISMEDFLKMVPQNNGDNDILDIL